ncbi:DUF1295 domain-containing protein [Candidatus Palauibacter sp.]|uniref:DUF1295 domain-containing protein n=1 Tax=Candidatus Palauibacter sp. TaxID=3101350 RepID=UPI003B02D6E8
MNLIEHPLAGTPFGTALDLCLILAALVWLLGVVTREFSWIDRLWSICPPVYCLIVAFGTDFALPRVNLMTGLVVLWGARLTFNFARKGGYRPGGEDYRWASVREGVGPVGMQVLNLTFVSFGQMLLIWLFTSPVHQAAVWGETPLGWLDFATAALFLVLFVGETVADEQMWAFQQDKKRRIEAGEEVESPFMTSGLFRFSRHPNYFCEIAMWVVFYVFGVAASGQWLHWTGLGFILLIALFIPSMRLTERISASKYPAYRDYQASTPALIPGLRFGRR